MAARPHGSWQAFPRLLVQSSPGVALLPRYPERVTATRPHFGTRAKCGEAGSGCRAAHCWGINHPSLMAAHWAGVDGDGLIDCPRSLERSQGNGRDRCLRPAAI